MYMYMYSESHSDTQGMYMYHNTPVFEHVVSLCAVDVVDNYMYVIAFVQVAGDQSASSTPVAMVTLNLLYSNRRTKFKVSSVLQRETQQDVEQTHQMVLEDRKMFLQVNPSVSICF